jgi:thioredoxin 1
LENEEEKELERIRRAKLQEIMKKSRTSEKEGIVLSKPIEVTDATFKEIIEKHPLVVVDCWAPWCGPCCMVAPIIEELARDYAGKVLFGKLNVDENPAIAMQYQIMSIPTLLVFNHGKLVDRIIGALPKQMLEPKITRHF